MRCILNREHVHLAYTAACAHVRVFSPGLFGGVVCLHVVMPFATTGGCSLDDFRSFENGSVALLDYNVSLVNCTLFNMVSTCSHSDRDL